MKWRKYPLLLATALIIPFSFAQKSGLVKIGDSYYKKFDFKTAIDYYARAVKKDSSNAYLRQQIADSYRLMNDWKSAEPWYRMLAQDPSGNPQNKMYYADALRANENYTEAKLMYKDYYKAVPADTSVKTKIAGLERLEELRKDRGTYSIENLTLVNSKYSDFGVSLYKDGSIMFCTNRIPDAYVVRRDNWTGGTFLQILQGKADANGNISSVVELEGKQPDKRYHEGTSSYVAALDELYFDRSNYVKAKPKWSNDKTVKLKIYRVPFLKDQSKWGNNVFEAVPFNNNEYSVCHPSLTKDGKTMYFASDMPGGIGGTDIYVTTRDQISGVWTTPINLGSNINTPGEDKFPFIAEDGTLYFASDGRNGLGGLDIYSSGREKEAGWKKAENLGYPINSNYDDFGFVIRQDNKNGFFCSNRPGGVGDDDIYKFVRKGISVQVIVYDAKTNENIQGAKVLLYEGKDEKGSKTTGKEGDVTFSVLTKRKYKSTASKSGYLPGETTFETTDKSLVVKIPLVKEGGINLEVTVIDKKTKEPIDMADVKLINTASSKDEGCKSNTQGKCFYQLQPATNYRIEAGKDLGDMETKYLTVSTIVSTVGKEAPATLYVTIELEKVKKGVAIKIENIYYDLDKFFIRPDAAKELDKLVKILTDNPTLEIELSSHTDCRATMKYNADLSAKRAKAAVDYIASRGINPQRMISAGYGESRLVNKCRCEGKDIVPCTDEEHQENRRTEFKILKF